MTALKNVYARLIDSAGADAAKIADLKVKIGTSFAVGLLTDAEQAELLALLPAATA